MKKVIYSIILLSFILLFSCTTSQNNREHFVVDIKGKSDPELLKKTMTSIKARLVPMETTDSILFNGNASYLYKTNDYLFVVDQRQKAILRYDKSGKFINKIYKKGQGPEEYITIGGVYIRNDSIYICDLKKMQIYNTDGEYLKTIVPPKNEIGQFYIDPTGKIVQSRYYTGDSQLVTYDENGKIIKEYFPTPEVLRNFWIVQGSYHSIGSYNEETYVSNYFDTNIYALQGDSIKTLATFDFGNLNIPENFFEGTTEEVISKYNKTRENSKAVFHIDNLTITDDWIIFIPTLFTPKVVIYCNQKSGKYLINNEFDNLYAKILGGYNAPDGYDPQSGEFYRLVNASVLKDAIEELKQSDELYLEKYPFLKGIDPEKMDEESNDWVIFFKL